MKKARPAAPAAKPVSKAALWAVSLTGLAALAMLMVLARDILAQLRLTGGSGGASSTRLLTGLFVVMCFAGFVGAALWKVLPRLFGKGEDPKSKK